MKGRLLPKVWMARTINSWKTETCGSATLREGLTRCITDGRWFYNSQCLIWGIKQESNRDACPRQTTTTVASQMNGADDSPNGSSLPGMNQQLMENRNLWVGNIKERIDSMHHRRTLVLQKQKYSNRKLTKSNRDMSFKTLVVACPRETIATVASQKR